MTTGIRKLLANIVCEKLAGKEEIMKDLDDTYPGEHKQALEDINKVIYYALGGVDSINDAIALFKNIGKVFGNHNQMQTLAWLRSEDNWYEESLLEPMW